MLKEVNYLKLNNDTDPTPFFNRYKTSVRYVDSMAAKVLDKLKESGDLDNTLVIITGDHGQEMNDNKLNFWGHNSNFTDAQVSVPFAIFGPGVDAENMQWSTEALTSHQDVVPTLMKHYLGVTNDVKDYSVGEDLLGKAVKRDWIISSNYSGYAIITNNNILEVGGGGQYQFMDKTNRQLKDQQPNFTYLQQALEQISRFYR
jgi:membrane-anchored protein YejM (alkaline phosphatase superfamily)